MKPLLLQICFFGLLSLSALANKKYNREESDPLFNAVVGVERREIQRYVEDGKTFVVTQEFLDGTPIMGTELTEIQVQGIHGAMSALRPLFANPEKFTQSDAQSVGQDSSVATDQIMRNCLMNKATKQEPVRRICESGQIFYVDRCSPPINLVSHSGFGTTEYPNNRNEECTVVNTAGAEMRISVRRMDIETCCDHVYLNDGDFFITGEEGIVTDMKSAKITFRSDESATRDGFNVMFIPKEGCNNGPYDVNRLDWDSKVQIKRDENGSYTKMLTLSYAGEMHGGCVVNMRTKTVERFSIYDWNTLVGRDVRLEGGNVKHGKVFHSVTMREEHGRCYYQNPSRNITIYDLKGGQMTNYATAMRTIRPAQTSCWRPNNNQIHNGAYNPSADCFAGASKLPEMFAKTGLNPDWAYIRKKNGDSSIDMFIGVNESTGGLENAYYSPVHKIITIGAGKRIFFPLCCTDVVGHELAHGCLDSTSGLPYVGQSGCLNEFIADITGKALEYFLNGRNTWRVADKCTKSGRGIRDMSAFSNFASFNPKRINVHDCSKYFNYVFYHMVEVGNVPILSAWKLFALAAFGNTWRSTDTMEQAAARLIVLGKTIDFDKRHMRALRNAFKRIGVGKNRVHQLPSMGAYEKNVDGQLNSISYANFTMSSSVRTTRSRTQYLFEADLIGPYGDGDLLVGLGYTPVPGKYDHGSFRHQTKESIVFLMPNDEEEVFVGIYGYQPFSQAKLSVRATQFRPDFLYVTCQKIEVPKIDSAKDRQYKVINNPSDEPFDVILEYNQVGDEGGEIYIAKDRIPTRENFNFLLTTSKFKNDDPHSNQKKVSVTGQNLQGEWYVTISARYDLNRQYRLHTGRIQVCPPQPTCMSYERAKQRIDAAKQQNKCCTEETSGSEIVIRCKPR